MAVQHVCDVCGRTMTEWRNLLVGRTGTAPAATQLYRPEMGRFEGETEKEVCADCFRVLDLWLRGCLGPCAPTPSEAVPNEPQFFKLAKDNTHAPMNP